MDVVILIVVIAVTTASVVLSWAFFKMQFSLTEKCMTSNVYISDIHFTLMWLQVYVFGSGCYLKMYQSCKSHVVIVYACVCVGMSAHMSTYSHTCTLVCNQCIFFGGNEHVFTP
jgi:hypothetical protein